MNKEEFTKGFKAMWDGMNREGRRAFVERLKKIKRNYKP